MIFLLPCPSYLDCYQRVGLPVSVKATRTIPSLWLATQVILICEQAGKCRRCPALGQLVVQMAEVLSWAVFLNGSLLCSSTDFTLLLLYSPTEGIPHPYILWKIQLLHHYHHCFKRTFFCSWCPLWNPNLETSWFLWSTFLFLCGSQPRHCFHYPHIF